MSESKAAPGAAPVADRPLSPHLQVWRWHVTMWGSILHRATGVALYAGVLILTGWVLALASGSQAYGDYMTLLSSPLGKLVLFGLTFAVFYHLANGVRHLAWDLGLGFEPRTADTTGAAAIAFGAAATLALWGLAAITGAL
jgi:succinate dehydrogenase / fumarate reductase cytochrome b subunit